jgi:hypothetical protein
MSRNNAFRDRGTLVMVDRALKEMDEGGHAVALYLRLVSAPASE